LKSIPLKNILIGSFKVSAVSMIETLISGRIAANITGTKFNQSREVFGLSISNTVSGLVGALPCSSTLLRTTLNVYNGATSKLS
jgi:SulP family sulfate permease